MQQLKTQLRDRALRFDGISIIEPSAVVDALLKEISPEKLRVTSITPELEKFNSLVIKQDQLNQNGDEPVKLSFAWNIPQEYADIDLHEFITAEFEKIAVGLSEKDLEKACDRIFLELGEIERRGLTELFKTIIFVLKRFKEENVIWGVGRGSSCASYILYILGLHSVDCLKYDIPLTEFFHD